MAFALRLICGHKDRRVEFPNTPDYDTVLMKIQSIQTGVIKYRKEGQAQQFSEAVFPEFLQDAEHVLQVEEDNSPGNGDLNRMDCDMSDWELVESDAVGHVEGEGLQLQGEPANPSADSVQPVLEKKDAWWPSMIVRSRRKAAESNKGAVAKIETREVRDESAAQIICAAQMEMSQETVDTLSPPGGQETSVDGVIPEDASHPPAPQAEVPNLSSHKDQDQAPSPPRGLVAMTAGLLALAVPLLCSSAKRRS
mmetsp:Transcript_64881/g.152558  ORF Transcript_64881/g.152558 Transcript_64881/m.152558 type:complete len:252 (-) Transcript_64881:184-939(-)